jgi:hypothetical protein
VTKEATTNETIAPNLGGAEVSGRRGPVRARSATLWGALLAVFGAILAAAVPSLAATVTGSSQGVRATMQVTTHNPMANKSWPIQFTVTKGGKSVKASLTYEWLYAGHVVHREHGPTFTGHLSETFQWPVTAVGQPLTFRAVVAVGKASVNLEYAVKVVR